MGINCGNPVGMVIRPLQDVRGALRRQEEELRLTAAQAEGRRRAAEEDAAAAAAVDALTARLQERRAALEGHRDGLAAEQEALAVRGRGAGAVVCVLPRIVKAVKWGTPERASNPFPGLQASQLGVQADLREREALLAAASQAALALQAKCRAAERRAVQAGSEARALQARLLDDLGEKAGEEQGAAHTLKEARGLAAAAAAKEARVAELRAQLERAQASAAAEKEQGAELAAQLRGQEAALAARLAGVAATEAELERQRAQLEASTRAMDGVNRRLQRLVEQGGDPEGVKGAAL